MKFQNSFHCSRISDFLYFKLLKEYIIKIMVFYQPHVSSLEIQSLDCIRMTWKVCQRPSEQFETLWREELKKYGKRIVRTARYGLENPPITFFPLCWHPPSSSKLLIPKIFEASVFYYKKNTLGFPETSSDRQCRHARCIITFKTLAKTKKVKQK